MKKVLNILLVLFMTTVTLPLQIVEATASSYTETFYGYETASYQKNNAKSGKKDSSYNDGYYRDAYDYHFRNKGSGKVVKDSLTIINTEGKPGDVAKYCFGSDKTYYITHVRADIDY